MNGWVGRSGKLFAFPILRAWVPLPTKKKVQRNALDKSDAKHDRPKRSKRTVLSQGAGLVRVAKVACCGHSSVVMVSVTEERPRRNGHGAKAGEAADDG